MKLLKGSVALFALFLAWGCDTNGNGNGNGEGMPAEVSAILSADCEGCHNENGTAPMPITNCDDLLAGLPSDPDTPVWEDSQDQINAGTMPLDGELDDADLDTLNDFFDDGVPGCE